MLFRSEEEEDMDDVEVVFGRSIWHESTGKEARWHRCRSVPIRTWSGAPTVTCGASAVELYPLPALLIVTVARPPVLVATEFLPFVESARTNKRLLAYDKKFAAEKNDTKLESLGLPKRVTKTFSEETVVGCITGPQAKEPAKAPTEELTAGTIDEKSFSTTATPGLS